MVRANCCLKKGKHMTKLTCFKAYDIRGRLGEELNEDIAWRIGR
ncbi:phosphoglucomutase, partial [Salmonella enterica subsp. enterica serovar Montevideo]|nr:phosphoglucomutase [Salmonella enterica subsp. enterica serovar Montevideo]